MPIKKHILYFLFLTLLSCIPSLMYACSKHMAKAGVAEQNARAINTAEKQEKSCCKKAANTRKHCDKCTRSGCGKSCHCAPYAQQYIVLTSIYFKEFRFKIVYSNRFKPFAQTFISSDYSFIWTPPKIG